ncbi:LPXTG cell wall anchor domain-containing protein [Streptomyces sp. NPDC087219]|uniref:LPXTG cell wall anchor domain-containing protein n=1 Tax=Streptomyces sp. NPDC087219 TaxID=3365770 RepID=UPI0037F11EB3
MRADHHRFPASRRPGAPPEQATARRPTHSRNRSWGTRMNRPAPLRSPVALLMALAVLCGTLAVVLAMAAPAKAATLHGAFTLQGGSGSLTDKPIGTGVSTSAACPAPADPARPYVKVRLGVVEPGLSGTFHDLAVTVAGEPLSGGAFTRPVDVEADSLSLQDGLKRFIPEGPLDGRYELRLYCRTAIGAETENFFSTMVQVTGDAWAPITQKATLLEVVSEPGTAVVGEPARIIANVQPEEAAGTVNFQKFVNEELVDIGTVDVTAGKAEVTVTESAVNNDGLPVVATFTPTDPEAHTPASFVYSLYVTRPTPTPTGTTPTPTGTGTPTPTVDPTATDTPTPTDTPTDPPSETPSDTPSPTGTPSPTASGDADTTGGTGTSGGSGGDSGGTGTNGGSGDSGSGGSGGTDTDGGNGGSLASTGASTASAALGSLALCLLGAAAVIQTRRRKAGARP